MKRCSVTLSCCCSLCKSLPYQLRSFLWGRVWAGSTQWDRSNQQDRPCRRFSTLRKSSQARSRPYNCTNHQKWGSSFLWDTECNPTDQPPQRRYQRGIESWRSSESLGMRNRLGTMCTSHWMPPNSNLYRNMGEAALSYLM